MIAVVDARDHRLGLHGLALLRAGVNDEDAVVGEHRAQMRRLLLDEDLAASRTLRAVSTSDGYAHWAATYDERPNPTIAAEEPAVRALVADIPPGDAVDVGCGTGRHTRWLVERGHRVTAVDGSPEMLAIAARTVPAATTILADVEELPLPDQSADVVVCALVLSHQPNLDAIGELARLLRPGGRLLISNPHPFATAVLGSRAWTITPDGERVRIPEHAHPLGAYIDAFHAHHLAATALMELPHPDGDELLADQPAVIVWAAERR